MIHINQNVKLKVGGLKAPKMSIQDFRDMIFPGLVTVKRGSSFRPSICERGDFSISPNHGSHIDRDIIINTSDPQWKVKFRKVYDNPEYSDDIYNEVAEYIWDVSRDSIKKDRESKCDDFDSENTTFYGIEITKSGVPYLLCSGCGDAGYSDLCYMYYWDGKDFRLYIPTKGNLYNPSTRSVIGVDWSGCYDDNADPLGADLSILSKEDLDYYMEGDFRLVMSQVYPNDPFKHLPTEENIKLFQKIVENYELEIDLDSCREEFESVMEGV